MSVEVHAVLIPDRHGILTVVDPVQLLDNADETDDIYEAILNSGFDSLMSFKPKPEEITGLLDRVRKLNETGDAGAYWA
jgi:hypothetical protein